MISLATVVKCCYYFNYKYKEKRISNIQPSLGCKEIIIPTVLKCFLYLGLIKITAVYRRSLDGTLVIILNMLLLEWFRIKVTGENYNLLKSIAKTTLLTGAITLTTPHLQFTLSLDTSVFLLTTGTLTLLSFVDLHSKVFQIYKPSIQQLMSKQYITELIIYSIYLIIILATNNTFDDAIFILNKFPYVAMFVCLLAVSEYAVLEFVNKKKFGELVFALLTGMLWALIYQLVKQPEFQQRYIYGIGCFILSLLILTGIFQSQIFIRLVQFLLRTQSQQQQRFSVQ